MKGHRFLGLRRDSDLEKSGDTFLGETQPCAVGLGNVLRRQNGAVFVLEAPRSSQATSLVDPERNRVDRPSPGIKKKLSVQHESTQGGVDPGMHTNRCAGLQLDSFSVYPGFRA